jgi:hypothetical protein
MFYLQYQDSIEIVRRDGSSCSVLPQSQAYEGAAGAFIPAAGMCLVYDLTKLPLKGLGHEINNFLKAYNEKVLSIHALTVFTIFCCLVKLKVLASFFEITY